VAAGELTCSSKSYFKLRCLAHSRALIRSLGRNTAMGLGILAVFILLSRQFEIIESSWSEKSASPPVPSTAVQKSWGVIRIFGEFPQDARNKL
jgi:hypothetical protein